MGWFFVVHRGDVDETSIKWHPYPEAVGWPLRIKGASFKGQNRGRNPSIYYTEGSGLGCSVKRGILTPQYIPW